MAISWADMVANPHLVEWVEREQVRGNGRNALVVGCGLGDDVEYLAERGFAVTGFDVSPTAIQWALERFPTTRSTYRTADALALPPEWVKAFDFVFECYTLQVLPADVRREAIVSIGSAVAIDGELLVVCRGRGEDDPEGSLPWPLTRSDLSAFESEGLTLEKFEDFWDAEPVRRFRALFRRGYAERGR
jgi:SAM-dependent methyltransferase